MQRFLLPSLFLTIALLLSPNMVSAQDSHDSSRAEQITPENVFGGLFDGSMQAQLTEMATKMIDGYLDYLAKPQTTK